MSTSIPSHLSDADLVAEVLRLAHSARATTVALVAHLAELDARRLYLGAGFSSLFMYCTAGRAPAGARPAVPATSLPR